MPTALKHPTYTTGINPSEDVRETVIELLNVRLADSLDLSTQARQAFWSVKSIDFHKVHLLVFLLGKVAEHAAEYLNMIAEHTIVLGGIPRGTARLAIKSSSLPEYNLNAITCKDHLKTLSRALAKYLILIHEAKDEADGLGDKGTAHMFNEIAHRIDEDLYFLEIQLDA
jgi:starvation-inducible DNA-binding protein